MQINGYHLEAPLGEDELGLTYAGRAAGGLAQVAVLVLHAHLCGEPHTDRRLRTLCEVLRGKPASASGSATVRRVHSLWANSAASRPPPPASPISLTLSCYSKPSRSTKRFS